MLIDVERQKLIAQIAGGLAAHSADDIPTDGREHCAAWMVQLAHMIVLEAEKITGAKDSAPKEVPE